MTCAEVREAAAVALLTRGPVPADAAAHAVDCAACREQLDELAATVGLLALTGPDVIPRAEQPDPALLGRLLAAAADRRRRGRVRVLLATAAALVLVVALGAGAVAVATHRTGNAPVAASTGTAHDTVTGVTGTARVEAAAGGASVAFDASGVAPGTVCTLRVVTRDGAVHDVLTWTAAYTSSAAVTGTAAVPASSITRAELVDAHGKLLVPVELA